jgi:hypothetical protein
MINYFFFEEEAAQCSSKPLPACLSTFRQPAFIEVVRDYHYPNQLAHTNCCFWQYSGSLVHSRSFVCGHLFCEHLFCGLRRKKQISYRVDKRAKSTQSQFSHTCIRASSNYDSTSPEDISSMSTADLKLRLKALGISTNDCFERTELLSRLLAVQSVALEPSVFNEMLKAGGVQMTLVRLKAKEGSLGSAIQIDDKSYYAVKLRLIDSGGMRYFVLQPMSHA